MADWGWDDLFGGLAALNTGLGAYSAITGGIRASDQARQAERTNRAILEANRENQEAYRRNLDQATRYQQFLDRVNTMNFGEWQSDQAQRAIDRRRRDADYDLRLAAYNEQREQARQQQARLDETYGVDLAAHREALARSKLEQAQRQKAYEEVDLPQHREAIARSQLEQQQRQAANVRNLAQWEADQQARADAERRNRFSFDRSTQQAAIEASRRNAVAEQLRALITSPIDAEAGYQPISAAEFAARGRALKADLINRGLPADSSYMSNQIAEGMAGLESFRRQQAFQNQLALRGQQEQALASVLPGVPIWATFKTQDPLNPFTPQGAAQVPDPLAPPGSARQPDPFRPSPSATFPDPFQAPTPQAPFMPFTPQTGTFPFAPTPSTPFFGNLPSGGFDMSPFAWLTLNQRRRGESGQTTVGSVGGSSPGPSNIGEFDWMQQPGSDSDMWT